jgi:hypothetical protein
MAFFHDTEDLTAVLGGFFETLRHVEQAHLIYQIGGAVTFVFHRPEAQLTWIPEYGEAAETPFRVRAGMPEAPSLLTFEQDGDTAHRFWLGAVDLQQALARQQVRARGPLSRAMKLVPHLDTIYPLYHAYVGTLGRPELLPPAAGAR